MARKPSTSNGTSKGSSSGSRSSRRGSRKRSRRRRSSTWTQLGLPEINLTLDQYLDIAGYLMIALAALLALSFLSPNSGKITAALVGGFRWAFGWGAYLTPLLEADPPGVKLYRRLGFTDDFQSLRFEAMRSARPAAGERPDVEPLTAGSLQEIGRFDAHHFGADRSRILAAMLSRAPAAFCLRREGEPVGYVVTQPLKGGVRIGPAVAVDAEASGALLDAILARLDAARFTAGIPAPNRDGALLLRARGSSGKLPSPSFPEHPSAEGIEKYGGEGCRLSEGGHALLDGATLRDTGRWGYIADPKSACAGLLFYDCTHADSVGIFRNSY